MRLSLDFHQKSSTNHEQAQAEFQLALIFKKILKNSDKIFENSDKILNTPNKIF